MFLLQKQNVLAKKTRWFSLINTLLSRAAYLKEIAQKEDYQQLLKDLLLAANDSEDEQVWERHRSFCEAEILPNINFVIAVSREE